MQRVILAAAAAALLLVPAAAEAQRRTDPDAFRLSEQIAVGGWLNIHNVNGAIDVEPASGNEFEIRAEKSWRRGDPQDVRIEVVRDGGNLTVCALYTERSTCEAGGMHTRGGDREWREKDRDVAVHFRIRLPKGVNIRVHTVNGSIDVRGAEGQVVARTVNGRVDAASNAGPVEAETVNGSINVSMKSLPRSGDLEFTTVNGSVHVEAPASLAADVSMATVNGSFRTDFPMTVRGKISKYRMEGTIGDGGRQLRLKTVNGSIELKRVN